MCKNLYIIMTSCTQQLEINRAHPRQKSKRNFFPDRLYVVLPRTLTFSGIVFYNMRYRIKYTDICSNK